MPKTEQTKLAERLLIFRAVQKYKRFCLEVNCSHKQKVGIVDFITCDLTKNSEIPEFTCYEIKVSESDFNSEHGHNLSGEYNYYVLPSDLYKKLKSKGKYDFLIGENKSNTTGIYTFTENGLRKVKNAKKTTKYNRFNIEEKMRVIDGIFLRWTTGSMQKTLDRYGIVLKNQGA